MPRRLFDRTGGIENTLRQPHEAGYSIVVADGDEIGLADSPDSWVGGLCHVS
ncbi:MAG: hypothetical protein V5A38_09785 [Halolamina sp.]|uniref:hypothetical protein n=1 Tax=Halolamina sp. TaxID=1940283 RepID=UPI002FC29D15